MSQLHHTFTKPLIALPFAEIRFSTTLPEKGIIQTFSDLPDLAFRFVDDHSFDVGYVYAWINPTITLSRYLKDEELIDRMLESVIEDFFFGLGEPHPAFFNMAEVKFDAPRHEICQKFIMALQNTIQHESCIILDSVATDVKDIFNVGVVLSLPRNLVLRVSPSDDFAGDKINRLASGAAEFFNSGKRRPFLIGGLGIDPTEHMLRMDVQLELTQFFDKAMRLFYPPSFNISSIRHVRVNDPHLLNLDPPAAKVQSEVSHSFEAPEISQILDKAKIVTVDIIAKALLIPSFEIIKSLMERGIMVTINEEIDHDIAVSLVHELLSTRPLLKRAVAQATQRKTLDIQKPKTKKLEPQENPPKTATTPPSSTTVEKAMIKKSISIKKKAPK